MSSYATYCQDQAADCARRARLASSPEIVAYCRSLELRWLKRSGEVFAELGGLSNKRGPRSTWRHASNGRPFTALAPDRFAKFWKD